jgi:hypothetical protein
LLLKDHTRAPSGDNAAALTPTSSIPPRNPEPLPTAAANYLAHISALASLDTGLAQISSIQDTDKNEGAPLSVMTGATLDAETDDFESRLRALEGELEMIDQDVSRELEEVVEIWGEYVPVDGESERYRFGGGEASQDVPQLIFEVRSDILHQLLRNLTKLSRCQKIAHSFSTLSRSLLLLHFKRRLLPFNKRYNYKPQLHPERQHRKIL